MTNESKVAHQIFSEEYTKIVKEKYPQKSHSWPILSGYDVLGGQFGNYIISILKDTGNPAMMSSGFIDLEFLSEYVTDINSSNVEMVREKIRIERDLKHRDYVVILATNGNNLANELEKALKYHEIITGVVKMKIFLSHKSIDKELVREVKKTLNVLGFDAWLDEDDLYAGVPLERSIMQGFKDSCAAIFFVTPDFKDEDYLGSEVEYAIAEKRLKKNNFAIITLVLEKNGSFGVVPDLLSSYVYKQPKNELQMIQHIIKALPMKLGRPMMSN